AYFKDVEAGLAEAVREAVGGVEGAKLDESVFDLARVGRIPGTYNPKARSWCTLVSNSEKFYDLKELSAFGRKKAWPHIKRNTARNLKRATGLLRSRLHGIERLQRHRKFNCVGSRENMCFVYYNTATQIYGPEKALQVTLQLNAKFNTPLPVADIEQISRTVDNNVVLYGTYKGETGFYPLKASSVAEKLSMTQEEMATTKFFGGKRERDRAALKARNAAKRKAIDEKIAHMYKMGSTQKAIAKRIGCSVRKVAYVLSSLGIGNDDRSPLEEKFTQVIALHDKDAILRQPSWLCAGLPLPSPDEGFEGAQHSDDESWWRFNPGSMLMGCGARTPATARSKAVLKGVEARRC
ncbi:MAG: hypothetical protein IJ087_11335, partial [Eggerthellaceae bacterium]|nr:hypothetical protein [Eggerthellaceae bacterium]